MNHVVLLPPETAQALVALAVRAGVQLTVHAPGGGPMDTLDRKEADIRANLEAGRISEQEAEQQLADVARYREAGAPDGAYQAPAPKEEERGSPDDPSGPTEVDSHRDSPGGEGGPDSGQEDGQEDAGATEEDGDGQEAPPEEEAGQEAREGQGGAPEEGGAEGAAAP